MGKDASLTASASIGSQWRRLDRPKARAAGWIWSIPDDACTQQRQLHRTAARTCSSARPRCCCSAFIATSAEAWSCSACSRWAVTSRCCAAMASDALHSRKEASSHTDVWSLLPPRPWPLKHCAVGRTGHAAKSRNCCRDHAHGLRHGRHALPALASHPPRGMAREHTCTCDCEHLIMSCMWQWAP